MSLQTNCAQFRILQFVSEDTLGLEASYRVDLAIAKETAYKWGVTHQTAHYEYD